MRNSTLFMSINVAQLNCGLLAIYVRRLGYANSTVLLPYLTTLLRLVWGLVPTQRHNSNNTIKEYLPCSLVLCVPQVDMWGKLSLCDEFYPCFFAHAGASGLSVVSSLRYPFE